ncbi:uncharacterized protein (TIGR00269 family) [Desulfobaculum xiamenense]|uniref:Uncharacterized protein (TIGR00269 family) n=1 Tax=Desulfobaculum xiamenense TaxID=995050 RepID=A0A846QSW7_9BACT|nr:ATP-binding protein [Desulfobaculum xiamenense]NJB67739.1 uncharacterized protein (TIGR00269 family) [Desulfobaculum xiamenense]
MKCSRCKKTAQVALPSHHAGFCPECFNEFFSRQVERAIRHFRMFTRNDRVLVALSGGKDSLALFRELHVQGYNVTGLHIDLAINGSSPHARQMVERFCEGLGAPLRVVSMAEEGLSITEVKHKVKRPICSVCGKVKRYYFNKVALDEGFTALCTGHNLDDEVGRLLANTLRWDVSYLSDQSPALPASGGFAPKYRPLYRLSEFETAAYCFFNGIEHSTAVCPYSAGASFPVRKELLNTLEEHSPGSKLSFYETFLKNAKALFEAAEKRDGDSLAPCTSCGYPTSAGVCNICRLKEQLRD